MKVYAMEKGKWKGLRWYGFAQFFVQFAEIFFLSCGIAVLQNQAVLGVFRNFGVISMRFVVFLCYSVRCLYEFLCGFAVIEPPYAFLHGNDVIRFENFGVTSVVDKSIHHGQLLSIC